MAAEAFGAYVHLPYCPYKCHYCDFNAYRLPRAGGALAQMAAAIAREIEAAPGDDIGRTARSVYFGGGTPSLFPAEAIASLLAALRRRYRLSPRAEITVECNPGTVDAAGFRALRRLGVNRISLGAQTFHDGRLRALGRGHTARETVEAFRAARRAGFRNISLDLIYGLPGETAAECAEDARRAAALGPEHVSAYALELEAQTVFGHAQRHGLLRLPADEEVVAMGDAVAGILGEAGLRRYEVSNFARPGRRSRHNLLYWHQRDYRGFGPGAHSHSHGERFWNAPQPGDYMRRIDAAGQAVLGRERLSDAARMGEWIYLRLRLEGGVPLAAFRRRFGVALDAVYPGVRGALCRSGLIVPSRERLAPSARGLWLLQRIAEPFLA